MSLGNLDLRGDYPEEGKLVEEMNEWMVSSCAAGKARGVAGGEGGRSGRRRARPTRD